MRKLYLSISACIVFSVVCSAQDGLRQFSANYFRSDPLQGSFSGFLQHLLNDPAIQNKVQRPRTDTNFFFFQAEYKQYNPFFFKPKRVQVILEQTEVQYSDSTDSKDTIFVYQLAAFAPDTRDGMQDIKKEFDKIHRQYSKRFFENNYHETKEGSTVTAATHNYFVALAVLSPLSVTWARLESKNELALILTLRIKSKENQAVLPTSLYNPE